MAATAPTMDDLAALAQVLSQRSSTSDDPATRTRLARETDALDADTIAAEIFAEIAAGRPDREVLTELHERLDAVASRHHTHDLLGMLIRSYLRQAGALLVRSTSAALSDVRAELQALHTRHFGGPADADRAA